MHYRDLYNALRVVSWTGKGGLYVSYILFLILTLFPESIAMQNAAPLLGHGVCFSSPEGWKIGSGLSLWLNILLLSLAGFFSVFFTKRSNFLAPDNQVYAIALFMMCGATPMVTERLNSGVFLLALLLICFHMLFGLYGRRNCPEQVFIVFSLLSFGSMWQYGFMLLIPVMVLATLFLNILRPKEIVALILGVITPYWIFIALGIVSFSEFHMPSLTNLFRGAEPVADVVQMIVTLSITAILFIVALIFNNMAPASEGAMQRARRSIIHLVGFALLWFMVFDFTNMLTYMPAFFLCTGYECALWCRLMRLEQRLIFAFSIIVGYLLLTIVFGCL